MREYDYVYCYRQKAAERIAFALRVFGFGPEHASS